MPSYSRRLPLYLLLDCSGSMAGPAIEAVRQGIRTLHSELNADPQARETVYVSVITFADTAEPVVPLTAVPQFQEPSISASGMTSLGAALNLLSDKIETEVRKNTQEQKGDWKPLVFILTDGYPTDENILDNAITNFRAKPTAITVACMCGDEANPEYLKKITENVLWMNTVTPGAMQKFFVWVSQSTRETSHHVNQKPGEQVQLPPAPQGFVAVP